MTKRIFTILCAIVLALTTNASVYEVHALRGLNANAYEFKDGEFENIKEITSDPLHLKNGTRVSVNDSTLYSAVLAENILLSFTGTLDYFDFAIVEYEGKQYLMEPYDLRFSKRNNGTNAEDYLYHYRKSALERFYNGITPFVLIFLLLIGATFCVWRAVKTPDSKADTYLLLVPVLTTLVIMLELFGAFSAGGEMFWWLNYSRYGMLRSLLLLIPLVAAAAMQFGGMPYFLKAVEVRYGNGQTIEVKPLVRTLVYTAIGFIVAFFIVAFTVNNDWVFLFVILLALGVIVFMVYHTSKRYQEILGKQVGIIFTAYAFIWALGAVVAAIFYIWAIIKVIIPLIILAGIITVLGWVGKVPVTRAMSFFDKAGGAHTSGAARDAANARMNNAG